jgi:hypothetical protein
VPCSVPAHYFRPCSVVYSPKEGSIIKIYFDLPSPTTLSPPTSSPSTTNQPPANPNAPLPSYGKLAPVYVVTTCQAPLAQAQYAETRASDRVTRYAARANRAYFPPQQHHLAQGIASVSYSDASVSSPGFNLTGRISIGRKSWHLETSAGTSYYE